MEEVLNGVPLVFKSDELSILDMERLIDKGYRFDLRTFNDGTFEYSDVKEYLDNGWNKTWVFKTAL